MAIMMNSVLRWPVFTGSMAGLILVTLALTIPLAWGLRRRADPSVRRDDLLVVFVYDVDSGFFRGGRPAVDTDVACQQLRFVVVQSIVG